jgi:hypothetical protein
MPTASARTVIVVPCYQEANRLEVRRYRDFADSRPDVDFVLVDDGSTD